MKYDNDSKVFVGEDNSKLTTEQQSLLNSNIKRQKELVNDENVSAVIYSNLDAIKQGLTKGGVDLDKTNLQMGNTPEQIAKTFLNAVNFTLNFDLPKKTGNAHFKNLFLAGDHDVNQVVVESLEKLLNGAISKEAIEHGVIHYKGHVTYHNHVKNKEMEIKMKDGAEAQIKFVKENLDDHIGIINRLKEIKSESKAFFQTFGKNVLNETTMPRIKEDLINLMKVPSYTLTYGIGGESGVMKIEALKEKAINTMQNLWERTIEYVQDIKSLDFKNNIHENTYANQFIDYASNARKIRDKFDKNEGFIVAKLKM